MTRYKLLSDDDGHDFVVPVEQEKAFDLWLQSVYDPMCEDLPMPEGVQSIGGSPSLLTFTDPQIA